MKSSRSLLNRQYEFLKIYVNDILTQKTFDGKLVLPGEDVYKAYFTDFLKKAIISGMLQATKEIKRKRLKYRVKFGIAEILPEPVLPEEAIMYLQRQTVLQDEWNKDLNIAVSRVLVNALTIGASTEKTIEALRTVFVKFSRQRLEIIARTEATGAYNMGRLMVFEQNADFVRALQFLAVLDSRVTPICYRRNGLILPINDPRVRENTPPLHYQCRSLWSPIDKYEYEALKEGKEGAIEDTFGVLGNVAPRDLNEALSGWNRVPMPKEGFGRIGEIKRKGRI